jgi:hypothetical protein
MKKVFVLLPLFILTVVFFFILGAIPVGAGTNLLQNPDFSSGFDGWSELWTRESGKGRAAITTKAPAGFQDSLGVEHTGAKDWAIQQKNALTVVPGEIYRYGGRLHFEGTGVLQLSFVFYGSDQKVVDWQFGKTEIKKGDGWKSVGRRLLIPGGVLYMRFRITGYGPGSANCTGLTLEKTTAAPVSSLAEVSIGTTRLKVKYDALHRLLTITPQAEQGAAFPLVIENFGAMILPASVVKRDGKTISFSLFNALGDDAVGSIALEGDNSLVFAFSGKGPMEEEFVFPGTLRAQAGTSWVIPENEGLLIPADDASYDSPWAKPFYQGHGGFSLPFIGLTNGTSGFLVNVETPDDVAARYSIPKDGRLSAWSLSWQPSLKNWSYERRFSISFIPENGYVGIAKAYRAFAAKRGLVVTLAAKAKLNPAVRRLPGCVDLWFWKKGEWWQNEPDPRALAKDLREAGIAHVLWSNDAGPEAIASMNEGGFLTGRYDIYQDIYSPGTPLSYADLNHEAWPAGLVQDEYGVPITGWVARDNGKEYPAGVICSRPGLDLVYAHVREDLKKNPYTARFLDTTTACPLRECYNPAHPESRSDDRLYKGKQLAAVSLEMKLVTGSETGQDWAVPYLDYFEGMMSIANFRLKDSGYDLFSAVKPDENFLRFQVGPYYRIPLFELVYHDCVVSYYYWGDASNRLAEFWDVRDLFNALYGTGPLWVMDYPRWKQDKSRFVQSYKTATTVSALTGFYEMLEHRFISADHSVQYTKFANGTVVWVNFGTKKYAVRDNLVIGPKGFVIE